MRVRLSVLALVLMLVAVPSCAADIAGIASVIDGDTIDIHGTRIRLHGMDAPESNQRCRLADGTAWRCGQEASIALADLIGRQTVHCEQRDTDRYGRAVAVCRVGDVDLGAWLVERGYALAYRRYSLDYVDKEDAARSVGAGMWQGAFIPPWEWRRGRRLSGPDGSRDDADRDCRDFATWEGAQAFYEAAGPGDPHRLDGDSDGIACEGLR